MGPDQVKRYNLETRTFVEAINPPSEQVIYDLAVGPDQRLYFSGEKGIYAYAEDAVTGFDLSDAILALPPQAAEAVVPPLISGVQGNIAFGPDGKLYVRNFVSGDVDRYDPTTGAFLNTFISDASIVGDLSTIQFGVDGNLHAFRHASGMDGHIAKFNGMTGALISETVITFGRHARGRITFLPVPEPSSVLLVMAVIAMAATCSARRRQRFALARTKRRTRIE
jgi:hypothetical protein